MHTAGGARLRILPAYRADAAWSPRRNARYDLACHSDPRRGARTWSVDQTHDRRHHMSVLEYLGRLFRDQEISPAAVDQLVCGDD